MEDDEGGGDVLLALEAEGLARQGTSRGARRGVEPPRRDHRLAESRYATAELQPATIPTHPLGWVDSLSGGDRDFY